MVKKSYLAELSFLSQYGAWSDEGSSSQLMDRETQEMQLKEISEIVRNSNGWSPIWHMWLI